MVNIAANADVFTQTVKRTTLADWMQNSNTYLEAGEPVLVTGAVPADQLEQWTPESLVNEIGTQSVVVSLALPEHGVPYADPALLKSIKNLTVDEFVATLRAGASGYLAQADLTQFPALNDRLPLQPPPGLALMVANLWLGARTRSGLHFDFTDNIFIQVHGTKRVVLSNTERVYRLRPFGSNWTKSQIDFEDPALAEHSPELAKAGLISFSIHPGEALFIPRGCWHYFATDEVSVSLNLWFGQPLNLNQHLKRFALAGPRVWGRTVADFWRYGLRKESYSVMPFSGPPMGYMLARGLGVAKS